MAFDGFVPPVDDYFRMPNEWINICAEIDSLAEMKIVQYVLRHTWGYQGFNGSRKITIDEFMHGRKRKDGSRIDNGTGLSKQSVITGTGLAIEHGYLKCDKDDKDLARQKKYYQLAMKSDVKPLDTVSDVKDLDIQSDVKNLDISGVKDLDPDVKHLDSDGQEFRHRSEKDTIERHYRKTLERQEGVGSGEPTAPTLFIHPEHSFLAFDSLEHPTLMVISFVDDDRAEVTNKARARIAETQAHILETKGVYVQVRKEYESVDIRTIDAPANVYHIQEKRQRRGDTDPRMKAVKIGDTHELPDTLPVDIPVVVSSGIADNTGTDVLAQEMGQSELNTPSSLGTAPAQRSALSPSGRSQANAAVQGADSEKPPMALTARQIKAQNEKREKELWAIIEAERNTKYTATQRKLYENAEGMKCLIADDISDETIRDGLQALDAFQRKSFTVLKFYGWLPNLSAKAPTPMSNGQPAKSKSGLDLETYGLQAMLKRQQAKAM